MVGNQQSKLCSVFFFSLILFHSLSVSAHWNSEHDRRFELNFHKENASHIFGFVFSSFLSFFPSSTSSFSRLSIQPRDLSGFHLFDGETSLCLSFLSLSSHPGKAQVQLTYSCWGLQVMFDRALQTPNHFTSLQSSAAVAIPHSSTSELLFLLTASFCPNLTKLSFYTHFFFYLFMWQWL